jgi:DNA invertase Pin-like site-specific DNA recombinase
MAPTQTITAAIYEPVSTGDASGASPALREYAHRKGWEVLEYCERPNTARKKRPVLNQMMYDAWRHKFDVVLVPTLDCFACSLGELSERVMRLHKLGIRFLTADESVDTDQETRAGRIFLHALTVLVQAESNMRIRNVRAGIAAAQRDGVHCGRPRLPFPRDRARRLQKKGLSIRVIASRLDLPAATVADALKRGRTPQTV